jgi:hypothetical protein
MRPKQRLPYSKKNESWRKQSFEYFRDICTPVVDVQKTALLWRAASGHLNQDDYTYVVNPLRETNPALMGYPAKMRNYDIISPNLNILIGDYIERQFPPIVYATNSNYDREQFEQYRREIITLLQQEFINSVANMGGPYNEEQITKSLEDIEKKIKSLPDRLASDAQAILDYVITACDILQEFRKLFIDYTVLGVCTSLKDVINDEIYYKAIVPSNVGLSISPDHTFYRDGQAARITYLLSRSEIHDRFCDVEGYTKEFEEWLDCQDEGTMPAYNLQNGMSDINTTRKLFDSLNLFGFSSSDTTKVGIEVIYVMWRSERKVYKVKTIDVFGNEHFNTYDESYKPSEWDEYTIEWIDELWEGYEIGEFKLGIQRVDVIETDDVHLLLNGRAMFTRFGEPQSLIEKGIPFQIKYNIVSYNMELTLNKSLDKLMIFPLSLIPEKEGWDENTVMYYAKALSFLFVNDAKSNFANAINGLKGVDLSLNQYIVQGYQILEGIKQQWDDICGFSAQRKANISPSAGKGTSELAVQRSYIVNENHFTEFEEFLQKEYMDIMNLSKYAYRKGKRAVFVNRYTGNKQVLDITNPEKFTSGTYGIFVKSGIKEVNKLRELKANAQAFAQNVQDPSIVARIINSDNYSEILEYMESMSNQMMERADRASQAEQQLAEAELQAKQQQLEFNYYKVDADNLTKERVAIISAIQSDLDAIAPVVNNPDGLREGTELLSMFEERQKSIADNFFKLKDIELKEAELREKEKQRMSNEKINREKNAVALKNKVVGEK